MEINRRAQWILVGCITAIAVFTLGAVGYIQIDKIDKPIFTECYMEIVLPEIENPSDNEIIHTIGDSGFQFKFITNIDEAVKVVGISFDDAPDLTAKVENQDNFTGFFIGENTENKGTPHGRFAINTVRFSIDDTDQKIFNHLINNNQLIELNHITVFALVNNKMQTYNHVNIGRIILVPTVITDPILEHISSEGVGTGDMNKNTEIYKVRKAVHLVSVTSPLLDTVQNSVQIKIGKTSYKDAVGMQFKEGEQISIVSQTHRAKPDEPGYFGYQLLPTMVFEDKDGTQYKLQLSNMNYINADSDFTAKGLRQYLNRKGEV